jgi:hypothetical protein
VLNLLTWKLHHCVFTISMQELRTLIWALSDEYLYL